MVLFWLVADTNFVNGIGTPSAEGEMLLTIFPNPGSGQTTVQWEPTTTAVSEILIRSTTGQIVARESFESVLNNQLNFQLNQPGFYLVEGLDSNGSSLGVSKLLITQ